MVISKQVWHYVLSIYVHKVYSQSFSFDFRPIKNGTFSVYSRATQSSRLDPLKVEWTRLSDSHWEVPHIVVLDALQSTKTTHLDFDRKCQNLRHENSLLFASVSLSFCCCQRAHHPSLEYRPKCRSTKRLAYQLDIFAFSAFQAGKIPAFRQLLSSHSLACSHRHSQSRLFSPINQPYLSRYFHPSNRDAKFLTFFAIPNNDWRSEKSCTNLMIDAQNLFHDDPCRLFFDSAEGTREFKQVNWILRFLHYQNKTCPTFVPVKNLTKISFNFRAS